MSTRPSNLLTQPGKLPLVAPSILSADFANLARDCDAVLKAGADLLHLDVMDGHFVPNLTMGPALVDCLRRALPNAFLDAHLMVTDPVQYVEPMAKAGVDHFTFNIEPALDPSAGAGMSPQSEGVDPQDLIDRIHQAGMTAGFAINPATTVEQVAHLVPMADMVLVMSVNPGFSGQAFMPEVLEKVQAISAMLRPDQRLEMDGGLKPDNAKLVKDAGCDVLVAASAIFGKETSQWSGIIAQFGG